MDVFVFVIIIVTVSVVAKTFQSYLDSRAKVREMAINSGNHELENEVQALKKRVEVLEKLVTDQGYQLNEKIRTL